MSTGLGLRVPGIAHGWVILGDGPYGRELEARLEGAVFMGTLDQSAVSRPMASAGCATGLP